jgi:hypothetical protein
MVVGVVIFKSFSALSKDEFIFKSENCMMCWLKFVFAKILQNYEYADMNFLNAFITTKPFVSVCF